MTYELTKKLKDAGFPIKPYPFPGTDNLEEAEWYEKYIPTLSELIEACGDEFMLTNETYRWEAWKGKIESMVRMGEGGANYEAEGSTPEEAVANLYIALHSQ